MCMYACEVCRREGKECCGELNNWQIHNRRIQTMNVVILHHTHIHCHTISHTQYTTCVPPDVMSSEQRDWFVDFYRKLSQFSPRASHPFSTSSTLSLITPSTSDEGMEAECKRLCAYNFPVSLMYTY